MMRSSIKYFYSILIILLTLLLLGMGATSCKSSTPTTVSTSKPNLTAISISGNPKVQVIVGSSQQLSADGKYEDGSSADLTSQVTWASSNTDVATITAGGLARLLNPGTTQITATLGEIKSQPVELDVIVGGMPMLELSFLNLPNLVRGDTLQILVRMMASDGTINYVKADSWTSSDTGVAVVSSEGLVTAFAPGTTNITASYIGYRTKPYPLTVVNFSAITVTPAEGNLKTGTQTQFTAIVHYLDGHNEDITAKAGWKCTNLGAAVFTSPGLLTAAAPGYIVIQAAWEGINSSAVGLMVVN